MTPIMVPAQSAYDPSRPISSLLKSQVEHLYEAETRLPLQYRSGIYVNAIKTEGEAANYIHAITEAIYSAHADAAVARQESDRKRGIEIAAVADEDAERRRARSPKKKRAVGKSRGRQKSN